MTNSQDHIVAISNRYHQEFSFPKSVGTIYYSKISYFSIYEAKAFANTKSGQENKTKGKNYEKRKGHNLNISEVVIQHKNVVNNLKRAKQKKYNNN